MPRDYNSAVVYKADYNEEKLESSMGYFKMNEFMKIGKKIKKVVEGKAHGTASMKWPTWENSSS